MADLNMVRELLRDIQEEISGCQCVADLNLRVQRANREIDQAEQDLRLLREDRTEGSGLRPADDRPTTWDVLRGPSYEFT